MSAGPDRTEPAAPIPPATSSEPRTPTGQTPVSIPTTPPVPATPVGPSMAAFGGNESCPHCGARMAADQRYCLNCGHRRGDPRLPFMDAVVFMESMSSPGAGAGATPPPPPAKSGGDNRWNANAALIAGVATLVLAIGVGFLIGRSGHDNTAASPGKVEVVQVGGAPATGEETAPATEEATKKAGEKSGGKSKGNSKTAEAAKSSPKATAKAKENSEVGEHGASKATEEVLHTEGDVQLAEPEVKVGGECTQGTAGCGKSGKFEGNFFGE